MTTYSKALLIDLIDPVITTAKAASAGAPEALPFIPGAMLHGAAASAGYRSGTSQETAFRLFHDGSVRFGDGLPIDERGNIGWPVPMSVRKKKEAGNSAHDEQGSEGLALFEGCKDFSQQDPDDDQQWTALKADAVRADMFELAVARSTSMRTAIDPVEGRAAESQLFAYEFIVPDRVLRDGKTIGRQRFVATVEADTGEDLEEVVGLLKGRKTLGRSKSAEFGRVHITAVDVSALSTPDPGDAQSAFVWCLSDFWPEGEHGQPLSVPISASFGFDPKDDAEINWQGSFMLTRRISPYNAKWQSRGLERDVVQRGSVFRIDNVTDTSGFGLKRLGFGREIGCGWMLISHRPPIEALAGLDVKVVLPAEQETGDISHIPKVEGINVGLDNWIDSRAPQTKEDAGAGLLIELKGHYEAAKRWNGKSVGPTPAQWGALRALIEAAEDLDKLLGKPGERKERDSWNARFSEKDPGTFGDWVRIKHTAVRREVLARLARDARNWLKSRRDDT